MLVVVGGHSRNIGKSSVVAGLIRRFQDRNWAAVKITQYGHGVCSRSGRRCGCSPGPDQPYALSEERRPNRTDSGRFLAAGAQRSFWLRAPVGGLAGAAQPLGEILSRCENVILESNSVLDLVNPEVFLMLLDFTCRDFKASSLRFLERADAFVVIDNGSAPSPEDPARRAWDRKPRFLVKPPVYVTDALAEFVSSRFPASAG